MKIGITTITKGFLIFLGVVLGVTGSAKLFAVADEVKILDARDWGLVVP